MSVESPCIRPEAGNRKPARVMCALAGFMLFVSVALPCFAQDETVRIEGKVLPHFTDPEGNEKELAYQSFPTLYFTLWRSGCKWMYRCSTDSNTDLNVKGVVVSYDGTNLYHLDPAARGVYLLGKPQRFQGLGDVDAKPVWQFAGANGPLWWAYASDCILQKDGPVPSFLIPWEDYPFSLKREALAETVRRVGPINATLSIQYPGQSEKILAEIHPLATNESEGILFITKCQVITYGLKHPINSTPKWAIANRWEIVLTKFGIENTPVSFVPQFEVPGLR